VSVHRSARGFDRAADVYERARPGYPEAAIAWLAEVLGLRAGRTVVDLAAGTGKLTAPLVATGARVIAVEPSDGMLAVLRGAAPGADVLEGVAEAIPLPAASADAVVVAQAFHWFRHDEALAEIHRVLRPGGALGIVYNRRDLDAPAHALFERLVSPHKGDTPRHRDGDWRRAVEGSELFVALAERELPNMQRLPRGALVDRAASTSFVAALPDAGREALLDELAAEEARLPDPVELPHVTELLAFRRVG
jgi:SAM-dependent methyltransferase